MTSDTASSGPAAGPEKYANADSAGDAFEAREQKQQQRESEWREATSKQRSIEQSLRVDTVELPVGGEPIQFSAFRSRKSSQWAATVREQLRGMNSEEIHSEFPAEVDRIYHELGERAGPAWMDQSWFESHFSIKMALDYVELINMDTDLSVEEFRSFRGK